MAFWWEEKKDNKNRVPSLDTGIVNARTSLDIESIFANENFKNISSMFNEVELKIAQYKAQGRSNSNIAEILDMTVNEVTEKELFMTAVYRKTFPGDSVKTNYRTINSKKGR